MMDEAEQQETFDRWLDEYSAIHYKLVRVYARSHHDQEDLFQEIVIQVWKSIPNFKATARESTYVYQVVLFAAMAWQRKEKQRDQSEQPAADIAESAMLQPQTPTDPRLDWLYDQIAKLEIVDRSLVLLLLEGHSYREIATLLGLSESNVGSRLTRLKSKLAEAGIGEDI